MLPSELQSLKGWENKFLLFKSSIGGISLWNPNQTNTNSKFNSPKVCVQCVSKARAFKLRV